MSARPTNEQAVSPHPPGASILDMLVEGVIVVGLDGQLVQANAAACEILALEPSTVGAEWWRRFRARTAADGAPLSVGRGVVESGEAVRDVDVEIDRDDGTTATLSVNYLPLSTPQGDVVGLVVSFTDVTEHLLAKRQVAVSRDFLGSTLDSLEAHVAVLDENGDILLANRAWDEFAATNGGRDLGAGANYLNACDGAAGDAIAEQVAAGLRAIIANTGAGFTLEYPCHSPTEERWFVLRAARFEGAGPARAVVTHADVTAAYRARAEVATQAALLDEVDVAVVATDEQGRVTHWNRGAQALYGWSHDEVAGHRIGQGVTPEDDERAGAELLATGRWEGDVTARRKDGSTFPAYVRAQIVNGRDGVPIGMSAVSVDMTQRVADERALLAARNHLKAVTDSMGEGLFTLDIEGRLTYMNTAAEALLGWKMEELVGLVMHDVTHRCADGSGVPIEDCPMLNSRRDGETVRVEDDSFLRRDGQMIPVAYTSSPFETAAGVEGCVVVFVETSQRKAREAALQLEADKLGWIGRIQDALADDRFMLYAQPIIDLSTGEAVQHELLLRMREPNGTIVAPGAYLEVAEEYGLIVDIDRWVIARGVDVARRGEPVEINVSARSIGDPTILVHIERCIADAGVDPTLLVFEITETAIVEDEAAARAFAERLRSLGCQLALDDFGTGYGGFTYLKHIPVDYLKIDIEFVRDLATNRASGHVVRAVVALASGFGLKTIAEGVEDAETLELLRALGVDLAQGYHLSRPAPLDEVLSARCGLTLTAAADAAPAK